MADRTRSGQPSGKGNREDAIPIHKSDEALEQKLRAVYAAKGAARKTHWDELIRFLQPFIRTIARNAVKGRGKSALTVEDTEMEVIAGFWLSYGKLKGVVPKAERLRAANVWRILPAIAKHKLDSHDGWLAKDRKLRSGVDPDLMQRTSPSASQWARGREFKEALAFLMKAELGERDRRAFVLRAVEGLSYEAILEQLRFKMTANTLAKRFERMRKRLKTKLSPEMLVWLFEVRKKKRLPPDMRI
jgi:RNA polymerase sigma factor (sigma-70 family)